MKNGGSHRGGQNFDRIVVKRSNRLDPIGTKAWKEISGSVSSPDHSRLTMCSPKLANVVPVPYESSNVKAGLILSLELFVLKDCKESRKTGFACSIGPQCDCMALRVLTTCNKILPSQKQFKRTNMNKLCISSMY